MHSWKPLISQLANRVSGYQRKSQLFSLHADRMCTKATLIDPPRFKANTECCLVEVLYEMFCLGSVIGICSTRVNTLRRQTFSEGLARRPRQYEKNLDRAHNTIFSSRLATWLVALSCVALNALAHSSVSMGCLLKCL